MAGMSHRNPAPAANTSGNYQTAAVNDRAGSDMTDHQVDPADAASVDASSVLDPLTHPYWPTFQARVVGLFSHVPAPAGKAPAAIAEEIWTKICAALQRSAAPMAAPGTYSNPSAGWVDMRSPGYDAALAEFEDVINTLASYQQSAFNAAGSFGFWSGKAGTMLAESICDLTLETSGIGGLFNGIPTLDGDAHGWDPDLWGGLSAGYARAIVTAITNDPANKTVHVCLGPNARADNIWGIVESETLRLGLADEGLSVDDFVTFHGAAAVDKAASALDTTKTSSAGVTGAVYSGGSWQDAADAATAHHDSLAA